MDVQKNVCFVSKARYLNVQKEPGYTVNKPSVGGGTVLIQEPAEFVKFKDHRLITNSKEIIDFIRKKIVQSPELGLREIKIKTKQELYEDELAKLQEQIGRVHEAKEKLSLTDEEKEDKQEKVVESAKKVVDKQYKCWLGNCKASSVTLRGLQKHLNDFHRKHLEQKTIIKKLNELAKEQNNN